MKTVLRWGEGAFIRKESLNEGGAYKLFLILGAAFIGEKRLKEGGRLLEGLLYVFCRWSEIEF